MVYPYECPKCDLEFDVIKHHSLSSQKEKCPECKKQATRVYGGNLFIGTSVESAEYNPGLGMVIKSKYHRSEECKRQGLVEIGNEKPTSLRKEFADKRESKRRKSYDDI